MEDGTDSFFISKGKSIFPEKKDLRQIQMVHGIYVIRMKHE